MSDISHAIPAAKGQAHGHSAGVFFRSIVIALTAFLSLVDLFATQAILPMLTEHYGVTPGQMGLASNASTLGMLVSGLAVGYFSSSIDRRRGILISLVLLSIPTALLAYAPNLTAFAILRILQGLCMASAFTLTLAYLGEHYSAQDSASAFAAYITGNVASNLIGRLISAGVADHFGLAANFYFFALLNLAGALLVYFTVEKTPPMKSVGPGMGSHFSAWIMHLKNPSLRASFAIGFCILFAFHRHLHLRELRPGAAALQRRRHDAWHHLFRVPARHRHDPACGPRRETLRHAATFWGSLGVAALGLPLMLSSSLAAVLAGMVLVGVGTFFAQATATGFVGRAATSDRGSASGLYLAFYFFGGLMGAALLGQLFDRFGWGACVAGIGLSLVIAALLAILLKTPMTPEAMRHDA